MIDNAKLKIPFQWYKFANLIFANVKIVKPNIERKKQIRLAFQIILLISFYFQFN